MHVATPTHNRALAGVLWMLASGLSFVGVNGIVRHLGTDLPAAQSAFLRFAFGVMFLLPILPQVLRKGITKTTLPLFLWRGAAHTGAVVFWFYAMARIPVAHATAIGYLNPVLLLVASALLLGEALTRRHITVVGVALLGALVVLRPGIQPLNLGHLSQLGASTCFAISYLYAKRLTNTVPSSVIVAMMSLTVAVFLAPFAAVVWVPVSLVQLGWLAIVAFLATLGHYLMTRAFATAPITVTQPVVFLQLVWASILGATVFAEPVDIYVLLGGFMIAGAILWLTVAEIRDARAP